MYLIPLTKTLRTVTMCTLLPLTPIKTITISETVVIYYSPLNTFNDLVLFLYREYFNFNIFIILCKCIYILKLH